MPFQSAPPHGERHEQTVTEGMEELFQSAPPHGERPSGVAVTVRV